jgi:hypothetical protein
MKTSRTLLKSIASLTALSGALSACAVGASLKAGLSGALGRT